MKYRQLVIAAMGSLVLHLGVWATVSGVWRPAARLQSSNAPIQVRLIAASKKIATPSAPAEEASAAISQAAETLADAWHQAAASVATVTSSAPKAEPRSTTSAVVAAPPKPTVWPYRLVAELDPPPRPLGDIEPEYPVAAGLQQGVVVMRILIGATGDVDSVEVVSATPPGLFEASAIEAFGKAKFAPGRYLGLPVRSQITIAVDYTPINRGEAVSGQGNGLGLRR